MMLVTFLFIGLLEANQNRDSGSCFTTEERIRGLEALVGGQSETIAKLQDQIFSLASRSPPSACSASQETFFYYQNVFSDDMSQNSKRQKRTFV